ncbi:hypothetical protein [Thiocapsa sp.]|uniref:hypothetical protein n=1 Tax=Thiocapsa sp. TaxID=2024551 RepID=UPI00342B5701
MTMIEDPPRDRTDVIHAHIACLLENGRDRSLSQKKPGWNSLLLTTGPATALAWHVLVIVDTNRYNRNCLLARSNSVAYG